MFPLSASANLDSDVENFAETTRRRRRLRSRSECRSRSACRMAFKSAALCSQDRKQPRFAVAQFLSAFRNLLFESFFASRSFSSSVFCAVRSVTTMPIVFVSGWSLANDIRTGTSLPVPGREHVFPANDLLVRLFKVVEKLIAHMRHDEIAEWNAPRSCFRSDRGSRRSYDCCKG